MFVINTKTIQKARVYCVSLQLLKMILAIVLTKTIRLIIFLNKECFSAFTWQSLEKSTRESYNYKI